MSFAEPAIRKAGNPMTRASSFSRSRRMPSSVPLVIAQPSHARSTARTGPHRVAHHDAPAVSGHSPSAVAMRFERMPAPGLIVHQTLVLVSPRVSHNPDELLTDP